MDKAINFFNRFLIKHFPSGEDYINHVFKNKAFRVLIKATTISMLVFITAMLTAIFLHGISERSRKPQDIEIVREWIITEAKIDERKGVLDSINNLIINSEYKKEIRRSKIELDSLRQEISWKQDSINYLSKK